MTRAFKRCFVGGALCVALALGLSAIAQAQQSITFLGKQTSSDYSDSGLDLGNEGFWFANFDAATANSGSAIDFNEANSLPSWVQLDPTAGETFGNLVTTSGGQGWATLTLPDGTTGESGAALDSETQNNSNNTIKHLFLGPGSPGQFIFHVVTDNTTTNNPAGRLRPRAQHDWTNPNTNAVEEIWSVNGPNLTGQTFDGSPDVYSFLYKNIGDGSYIKLQLNSGVDFTSASIAGIMFDLVPEPSSALLLLLGAIGCPILRRRRA